VAAKDFQKKSIPAFIRCSRLQAMELNQVSAGSSTEEAKHQGP